jgi:hypothetical protein
MVAASRVRTTGTTMDGQWSMSVVRSPERACQVVRFSPAARGHSHLGLGRSAHLVRQTMIVGQIHRAAQGRAKQEQAVHGCEVVRVGGHRLDRDGDQEGVKPKLSLLVGSFASVELVVGSRSLVFAASPGEFVFEQCA